MSYFSDNQITDAGRLLLAKGQLGRPINFTRMVLGDGFLLAHQSPDTMTELNNPKTTARINKLTISNRTAFIGATFTSQSLTEGFYYRELGLYATDPDDGEILFCYSNAGSLAEYIPPADGEYIKERVIEVGIATGKAENITAVIDSSMYATLDDLLRKADRSDFNTLTQRVQTLESNSSHVSVYQNHPTGGSLLISTSSTNVQLLPGSSITIPNPWGSVNRKVQVTAIVQAGGGRGNIVFGADVRTYVYLSPALTLAPNAQLSIAHTGSHLVGGTFFGASTVGLERISTSGVPVSLWCQKHSNNSTGEIGGWSMIVVQTKV